MEIKISVEKRHLVGFLVVFAILISVGFVMSQAGTSGVSHVSGEVILPDGTTLDDAVGMGKICTDVNGFCVGVDTNAETLCPPAKLLNGDGNCVDLPIDTNAETLCPPAKLLNGDGNCVDLPIDTNTDFCSGGNCQSGLIIGGTQMEIGGWSITGVEGVDGFGSLGNVVIEGIRWGWDSAPSGGDYWVSGFDANRNSYMLIHKPAGARPKLAQRWGPL